MISIELKNLFSVKKENKKYIKTFCCPVGFEQSLNVFKCYSFLRKKNPEGFVLNYVSHLFGCHKANILGHECRVHRILNRNDYCFMASGTYLKCMFVWNRYDVALLWTERKQVKLWSDHNAGCVLLTHLQSYYLIFYGNWKQFLAKLFILTYSDCTLPIT